MMTRLCLLTLMLVGIGCSTSATGPDQAVPTETSMPTSDETHEAPVTVLFVLTSHTELGDTGRPTGYFLSEVSHPWKALVDAGYVVDFMSPRGGPVEMDPKSRDFDDPINLEFWENAEVQKHLEATKAPEDIDPSAYGAIYFAGGHGAMWDMADNEALNQLTATIWEAGGAVSAVCHGPAALVNVTLSNGEYLVAGKKVAAFTDDEERAVELEDVVPFLLASTLVERGALHVPAENFQENVVVDGRLITGQNPASSKALGQALVEHLQRQ